MKSLCAGAGSWERAGPRGRRAQCRVVGGAVKALTRPRRGQQRDQPGRAVGTWQRERVSLATGTCCSREALETDGRGWTYLGQGPALQLGSLFGCWSLSRNLTW